MRSLRLLSLFLVATTFLLQGEECVSPFFADQQASDCCHEGHCSPQNPDPCCQVTAKVAVTHHQAKDKVQLATLLVWTTLPAWESPRALTALDLPLPVQLLVAASPPGELGNFLLPLLV